MIKRKIALVKRKKKKKSRRFYGLIWKNKSNNQTCITVPKRFKAKKGEYGLVDLDKL